MQPLLAAALYTFSTVFFGDYSKQAVARTGRYPSRSRTAAPMVSLTISRLHIAIVFYAVFIGVLLATRPSLLFSADGAAKQWGASMSETTSPFAISFLFPFSAILFYYLAAVLDFSLSA